MISHVSKPAIEAPASRLSAGPRLRNDAAHAPFQKLIKAPAPEGGAGNALRSENSERAFRFDELGMFGQLKNGETAQTSANYQGYDQAECPTGGQLRCADRSDPAEWSAETLGGQDSAGMARDAKPSVEATGFKQDSAPLQNDPLATVAWLYQPASSADRQAPDALRAAAQKVLRQCQVATAPVRLMVTESEGKLIVVARGQTTAEEALRLRRKFDDVAREFGLDILEFRLNGDFERVDPRGGDNGSFVR